MTDAILQKWIPHYYVYTQLRDVVDLVVKKDPTNYLLVKVHTVSLNQQVAFNYILTSDNITEEKRKIILEEIDISCIYDLINQGRALLYLQPIESKLTDLDNLTNMEMVFIWQLLTDLDKQCVACFTRPLNTNDSLCLII